MPDSRPWEERIESDRQAALAVLAPSRRDLEHGLELHAASVVCDAYGFSPTSPPAPAVVNRLIAAGADPGEIQDALEEQRMTRHVWDLECRREYLAAWQAAGVDCVFQNAGEEGQSVSRLLKRLARFTFVTDYLGEAVVRAVTPEQVLAARASGRRSLYFSGNGVPLAEEWRSAAAELGFIRIFFQLGMRMMHLTYNRRNLIGDGCGEAADAGLSDFGRAVVAEMNRTGVIVDVAHAGRRTSLEAARLSTVPMVASHSTAARVRDHIRAKPDEVIRAIADSGGYIGICCIPAFLGGGLDALLDHIEYVARKFGAEHVAIGADHGYDSCRSAAALRAIRGRPRTRPRWAALWPEGALDASGVSETARASLAWTNWPLFTVGLVQRGFSDDEIRNIIGGNVLRVAAAALAAAGHGPTATRTSSSARLV